MIYTSDISYIYIRYSGYWNWSDQCTGECTCTSTSPSPPTSANWLRMQATNPISFIHPFDIYSIFIKYLLVRPYQQLPSQDEGKIGAVLWSSAINGGYLSVLTLARNIHHSKGHANWEASIGHLIHRLNLNRQRRLTSLMSIVIIRYHEIILFFFF